MSSAKRKVKHDACIIGRSPCFHHGSRSGGLCYNRKLELHVSATHVKQLGSSDNIDGFGNGFADLLTRLDSKQLWWIGSASLDAELPHLAEGG